MLDKQLARPQGALSLPCMGLAHSDEAQCLDNADMRQLCHAGAAAMCCSWQVAASLRVNMGNMRLAQV